MLRRVFSIFLIILFLFSIFTMVNAVKPVSAKELPSTLDVSIVSQRIEKKLSLLKNRMPLDKSLVFTEYPVRVVAIFPSNVDVELLSRHFKTLHFTPKMGTVMLGIGVLKPGDHSELFSGGHVIAMTRDVPITLPDEVGAILSKIMFGKDLDALNKLAELQRNAFDVKTLELGVDSINREVQPDMYWANSVLGSYDVWTQYNISGANVTVAIIDTGVDYGSLGLGYDINSVARTVFGDVAAFDADGLGIVITDTVVQAYANGSDVLINTSNTDPLIYIFGSLIPFSWINGTLWMADMNVTGILNPGDIAHFGIMFQYQYGLALFPVLVVDSDTDGFYDTVYVDISFDWVWQGLYNITGFGPTTYDFSFADETPLTPNGWSIGARDFDGDKIYDVSVSSLGYGLDVFGVVPNIFDQGSILKPIDPYGNYTVFVYDFYGHGTACANVVAGRTNSPLAPFAGVAPNASILGVPAIFFGDIIEGWLWSAGFDLIPGTEMWEEVLGYGTVFGLWQYTGYHKADIISNSWGWSSWAYWLVGIPWYDVLVVLEDALMVPGYLDPAYPGTLMVHAAGNGGPGYGTVTEPGYNTLALTVGAATSLEAVANYTRQLYGSDGYLGGSSGDVISWSARGPNAFGNVKPEILGIGARGWTAGPVYSGNGAGVNSTKLFGGTSMATPTVAGVAALAIEASWVNNISLTPIDIKVLIKSTATDLGYDVLTQGAGLANALEVVEFLFGDSDIMAFSPGTYDNLWYNLWIDPWLFAYFYSSGYDLPPYPPFPPINDFGWFAGDLLPGGSSSTTISFVNPNTTHLNVTLTPMRYELINTIRIDVTTYNYSWFGSTRPGALIPLSPTVIPPDADLMVVTTNISYSDFDPEMDYWINNDIYLYVFDWYDLNSDGIPYSNESILVNYAYPDGTTTEVKIGNPASKFGGVPLIRLYQNSEIYSTPSRPPIHVTIFIKFLKRVPWNWITVTPSFIEVYNSTTPMTFSVNVTLTVPSNATPGLYHGLILMNITNLASSTFELRSFPVTVNVYDYEAAYGQLTDPLEFEHNDPLYPATTLFGQFDWYWRAETGDWRLWPIYLDIYDPYLIGAFTVVNWSSYPTDIDLFSIDPWNWLVDSSDYLRFFGGAFLWSTRTGTTSEFVGLWLTPGTHKVLLHNVLLDGADFPLNVTGNMAYAYMYPLPSQLTNIYGQLTGNYLSVGANFQVVTGLRLTNATFYDYSLPTGWKMSYPAPFDVSAFTSKNFTVSILVPTNATPGTYDVEFKFTFNELPYYLIVHLTVEVRKFPLPLTLTTHASNGIVSLNLPGEFGSISVYYYIDPLNPSNSRKTVYPVHVKNIILGDRFTYIDLMVGIKVNGRTWWVPSTLVIDRETRTVYLFGFIQFDGKY